MNSINLDEVVNPELSKYSLIEFNDTIIEVIRMDKDSIYTNSNGSEELKLGDNEWQPIFLDDEWLTKLGLKENEKIKNIRTKLDWTIRKSGKYYYLTIDKDISLGENPIIPVHWVHELQNWYYLLTNRHLRLRLKK